MFLSRIRRCRSLSRLLTFSPASCNPAPPPPLFTTPAASTHQPTPPSLPSLSPSANFSSRAHPRDDDGGAVSGIVELVAQDGSTLEADLSRMGLTLSQPLVSEVLRELTRRGVSALRFFHWASLPSTGFSPRAYVLNLLVGNVCRACNYTVMSGLLAELSAAGHCLTEQAFAFLAAPGSCSSVRDAAGNILRALDGAGGSCRASGVFALVKVLCSTGEFDVAVSVMERTARRTCYYNVLIAAKCRSGDFRGAREVFDEMRSSGCDPNVSSWNYLLGFLLKRRRVAEGCELLEEMEQSGYLLDSLTYEILTFHACKAGRMDLATQLLDQMCLQGLEPRIRMHAAFIKGYFFAGRADDAHKYVLDMSARDKGSANRNCSLLANLFRAAGRVLDAGRVLYEMMEKGLKPEHSSYVRVTKDLHKMRRGDLASELKSMFHKFNVQAGAK